MADADVRQMVADLPVPEFESTAFTQPPALGEATVGVEFQAGRTTERGDVVMGCAGPRTGVRSRFSMQTYVSSQCRLLVRTSA
jgi:hypothetical protein